MRRRLSICGIVMALLLTGCSSRSALNRLQQENERLTQQLAVAEAEVERLAAQQPPRVESVRFFTPAGEPVLPKEGWVELPEKVVIKVALSGRTTQVDVVVVPTGTQTYILQRVVALAIVEPGQQEAQIEWNVPSGTMDHLWVMAFNGHVARRSESVNVYRE